jgi:hypothetical protein
MEISTALQAGTAGRRVFSIGFAEITGYGDPDLRG